MPRFDDTVAYAANWKAVLAVDAGAGLVLAAVGIGVMALVHVVVGAFLASVGVTYVLLVVRRGRKWAALRREAGL
jgi:hypothetical protein